MGNGSGNGKQEINRRKSEGRIDRTNWPIQWEIWEKEEVKDVFEVNWIFR